MMRMSGFVKDQDKKNTITVSLIAGVLLGFILSMLMGVFGVGTIKEVPAWLQGVSGMVATLVSVFAVYLVAQTLQATRDMLDVQTAIGDAQTRAWVYVDNVKIETDAFGSDIVIEIRNYGHTPASNLSFLINIQLSDIEIYEAEPVNVHRIPVWVHDTGFNHRAIVAPNKSIVKVIPIQVEVGAEQECRVAITGTYQTVNSVERQNFDGEVFLKQNGQEYTVSRIY